MSRRITIAMTTLFALSVAGCGSDPAARPVTPAGAGAGAQGSAAQRGAPGESSLRVDDRIAKACNLPQAFFEFDSAKISGEVGGALDAVAKCFVSGPLAGKRMRIVGHADPRGETEYNFALGQKRAGTVASYMTRRGMDAGKVSTTSKGELDAEGTDEAGWAHDRRVEIFLDE